MTTFDRATDLPASIGGINGLEELKVWVDSALARLYGALEYEEVVGALPQKIIDFSVVRTGDGRFRMIVRSAIEISPDYLSSTNAKFWTFAQSLGTVPIPAGFRTDT